MAFAGLMLLESQMSFASKIPLHKEERHRQLKGFFLRLMSFCIDEAVL